MTQDPSYDVGGHSDAGRVRDLNEDQFVVADLSKEITVRQTTLQPPDQDRLCCPTHGLLLAVADGLGGHAAGEDASSVAVEAVVRYVLCTMPWFFGQPEDRDDELVAELERAVQRAQREVRRAAEQDESRRGMGTTLTLAYVRGLRVQVVHIGDSRCYWIHDGAAHQVTRDHTLAQRHVDEGRMSEAEAAESMSGHVLVKALGGSSDDVAPDLYDLTLGAGDALVLCTDGLTRHVGDDEIARTVAQQPSSQAAAQALVDAANAAGGKDNVTVIVARPSAL